jgi:O-succinylbenzoic acid--CoA ligase
MTDPKWSGADRAEADRIVAMTRSRAISPGEQPGWLGVRTGGSGGGVKFARHDEQTFTAAVRGFQAHFGLAQINAVDVLPAHHISGLMARVRCAATGGRHVSWDWKRLEAGDAPVLGAGLDWVISLVPTQLQRLLNNDAATQWLRGFRIIFLGGGPTWPALAEAAAAAGLSISLSYGMTETAAMVTALSPADFLAGDRSCGPALPHARVSVDEAGVVRVAGESIFRGYFPDFSDRREFITDDLGQFDARGHLQVHGRRETVIITGGKKVHPADVEAALRTSGAFSDVAVIGLPDPIWGEQVVACYESFTPGPPPDMARAVAPLAGYQRPKRFVAVTPWPRNAQGKLDRHALLAAVLNAGA